MPTTTDFEEFLDGVETADAEELHSLKMAVEEEDNCGPFEVQKNGEKIIVSICTSDLKLLLASDKAKKFFIEHIESKYGGEMGIDGQRDFNRQMEKD